MPKKVILISGGSDGLGKAIAEKLAPYNHVIILSHNLDKLRVVSKEINCDYVEAELTDYETLKDAVNMIIEKHHALDVLVNNAGIWMDGEVDDNDTRKIKELIDVNVTGTIYLTRAVLPGMKFRKGGQIINIISQDGLTAKKNRSIYHASKWAITGFTKCLQEDLIDKNINVTGVYPGLTKTDLFKKNGVERDLDGALDSEEVASLVEYVINLSPNIHIPEVGIINKSINLNNMDDTKAPIADPQIDPDMIAPQGDSPQATPVTPPFMATPPALPLSSAGVIDITPGSTDTILSDTPLTNHIDSVPLSEPKTIDITPLSNPLKSALTDITQPPVVPLQAPPVTPATSSLLPDGNLLGNTTKTPLEPITQSSPLAEDPDLVKLIK